MRRMPVVIGSLLLSLTGCGDENKDKKDGEGDGEDPAACTEKCTGKGFVAKATGKTIKIDFGGAPAGSEFVLMPFSVGDPATVQGSTSALKINFTAKLGVDVDAEPAKLVDLSPEEPTALGGQSDLQARDHTLRMLANRFDPSKGENQGPLFWALARQADLSPGMNLFEGGAAPASAGIEAAYRRAAKTAQPAPRGMTESALTSITTTTAAACPSGNIKRPDKDVKPVDQAIPAPAAVVDGGDFCIVYIQDPETVPDKEAIKAAVAAIMKNYKDVVYKDKFEGGAAGFQFKPVIAIMDFDDDSQWPSLQENAALNLAGAYLGAMSTAAKLPMIYMAHDLSLIEAYKSSTDKEFMKRDWHAVLAHEIQHAVLDWFRSRDGQGTSAPEGGALDEGLAHFMEGVHGYGKDVVSKWANPFLGSFTFGSAPFLASDADAELTDKGAVETYRAGPHSFLFYLSSQKGGVKFDGGKVSGGGGLDFIAAFAKSSKAGPAALSSAFGGEWVETVGNYFGALALDNVKLADPIADQFKTQGVVTGVKNLQGADGQFGMVFNGYEGAGDRAADYEKKVTDGAKDLKLYQTKPLLYKVDNPDASITFTVDQELPNTAVTVVRLK